MTAVGTWGGHHRKRGKPGETWKTAGSTLSSALSSHPITPWPQPSVRRRGSLREDAGRAQGQVPSSLTLLRFPKIVQGARACLGPPQESPPSSYPRLQDVFKPDHIPTCPQRWQVMPISQQKLSSRPPLTSAKKALSWSRFWKMLGELVSRRARRLAASSADSRGGCGSCSKS